jgi:hypothetical protein
MSDLYYRGTRVAKSSHLFELHEEWMKAKGSDKTAAKKNLDSHYDNLEAEFKKHNPNYQPYAAGNYL